MAPPSSSSRPGPPPGPGSGPRRRDRRGRGLRGPLVPAGVPMSLTRSEVFDDLVRTAVARLQQRWAEQLESIEVAVEDVPDPDDLRAATSTASAAPAALGRSVAATGELPARIVVYRRPVEARARGLRARETLVHEVVVEQLAELLGLDPTAVDPDTDG